MMKPGSKQLTRWPRALGMLLLVTSVLLVSCSKRSDDTSTGGSTTPQYNANGDLIEPGLGAATIGQDLSVRVISDVAQLPTGGTGKATITAFVTNESNQGVGDQSVVISADSGVLQGIDTETDENGEASATLTLARTYRNRDIVVTVEAGRVSGSTTIRATGTRLVVFSAADSTDNASTAPSETQNATPGERLSATLLSGIDTPIVDELLTFTTSAGGSVTPASARTDVDGQAEVSVSGGSGEVSVSAFDGTVSTVYRPDDDPEPDPASAPSATSGSAQSDAEPLQISMISNRNFLATGSDGVATITARVTDDSDAAVPGRMIDFRAAGGVLRSTSGVTDENGEASTSLGLTADYRNKDIDVVVDSAGITANGVLRARGSTLSVAGPVVLVPGETARLVATLQAGNGDRIADRRLTFRSRAGNAVTPETVITDAQGVGEVSVDSAAGSDEIFVSALDGTVIGSHRFTIATDRLSFDSEVEGSERAVGRTHPVSVTWQLQEQPVVGQPLQFRISVGEIAEPVVLTDENGTATVMVRSSSAGPATLTVQAAEGGYPATRTDFEFVASQEPAVAADSFRSPLALMERRLDVTIGTSNLIDTDAGRSRYTMPFLVKVADGSGAALENASVDVSVRTLRYYKGDMQLVDEAGLPLRSVAYFDPSHWAPLVTAECDVGSPGMARVRDSGDDLDDDETLQPQGPVPAAAIGSPAVLASVPDGTLSTDEQGATRFDLVYPANNALWATVRVTARAQMFDVESTASFDTFLPLLSAQKDNTGTAPPNVRSPFGSQPGCYDAD